MRHARFDVATLHLDGVPLRLKAAYLLVAERDGRVDLDWECLAYALDEEPLAAQGYAVDLVTLDGADFAGRAVLVRSVEGAHVLRGDGPLAGLDPSVLEGDPHSDPSDPDVR